MRLSQTLLNLWTGIFNQSNPKLVDKQRFNPRKSTALIMKINSSYPGRAPKCCVRAWPNSI